MKDSFLATLVAAIVLAGVPALRAASATTPSPQPSPGVVVHISNFAFSPANVTITAGQAVEFVNEDNVAHTVTAADKSFDSGDMQPGKRWTHVFEKAGTYRYTCIYHYNMDGTVTVKAAP